MDEAAGSGALDVVKWLQQNRSEGWRPMKLLEMSTCEYFDGCMTLTDLELRTYEQRSYERTV
ncbi:hypothetical protein PC116_g10532 [Phytophthora cactorum]|uniref:Uncharacterized protein n=1 Tax=Phytophthora cactorum TaxID=29920 RepID=A0A329RCB6_9STRA|nr:hypothetical protein Pcac1_g4205 [Phytophthora cactorum]KAG2797791.1 hypothetical protein PC111_g21134 [Phytophthora cactorum]KAG2829187.1 hypothetical protein PC113_g21330 [Phytophthora cactorum]KAG2876852.1 hypothetical protein PC114_g23978 [Phytophthora cactorum]KAG2883145.1 hypothetical protein PC115_g21721 [Phytophthora cactorum]